MEKILSKISQIKKQNDNDKILIAIDGFGGAGKSSLARSIVANLEEAKHIEFDWFHHPQDRVSTYERFDNLRFKQEIVQPFRCGVSKLSFKKYNWGYIANKPELLENDSFEVEGISTLIVEGAMTLHEEIVDCFNLKIWVDIEAQESRARGIKRDIEEYGLQKETVLKAWEEWGIWEDQCLERDDRRKRADLMI